MRKQMKVAAVLSATALLAIGASFTAMAAEKGTWALEEDGWVCYDKDGDLYEDVFCLDGGKEYYVGDDGVMLTDSWVEYDGNMYYVNSFGEKTTNAWKQLVPHDDEDAEEEWYWFNSNGKMAKSTKKVIDGKTYYFDSEGKVLYGWIDADNYTEASTMTWADGDDTEAAVYCDEETGARVAKAWVETYEPGVDDDEKEDADTYWYYIGSKGKAATGKEKSINGETYLFDVEGKMLSGWVKEVAEGTFEEIGYEKSTEKVTAGNVYFCGDSDDGHVKKNQWIKEWKPSQYYAEDADNSKKWYWITKSGVVFVPETTTASNAMEFEDADEYKLTPGDALDVAIEDINDKYYAFNANGEMQSGLIRYGENKDVYYFGGSNDGARKTGSVTLEDDYGVEGKFLFSTASADKGVGITGPKSGKLYEDGLLITAKEYKYDVVPVGDYEYIVNKSGSIQTTKKVYKDGDEVRFDASEGVTFGDGDNAPKGAIIAE